MRSAKTIHPNLKKIWRSVVGATSSVESESTNWTFPSENNIDLFFISGAKKSGTNWISNVLESHPQVAVYGELHFQLMFEKLREYREIPWAIMSEEEMARLMPKIIRSVMHDKLLFDRSKIELGFTKYFVGDHSPGAPYSYFTGAKRIAIVRDPRDVLISSAFHALNHNEYMDVYGGTIYEDMKPHIDEWKKDKWYFSKHPERLIHPLFAQEVLDYWSETAGSSLRAYRAGGDDSLIVIRYEDLHKDLEGHRASLLRFIGADPALVKRVEPDSLIAPGFNENPQAFFRKGIVGDWRNYQPKTIMSYLKSDTKSIMSDFGYVLQLEE